MAPRETENNAYAKFGVTNKEHYGMLWYFLEWSIRDDREQIQQAARAGHESGTTRMTSLTSRPLNRGTGDLVPHGRLRGVDVQMGCIDVGS